MNIFGRKKRKNVNALTFSGGDEFNYDLVGESFARDNLTQLVHGKESEGEIVTKAVLKLEPTNQFDPNAVEALIEGKHVGYIPKHDSAEVTAMIKATSKDSIVVPARIGWDTDNPMPLIGVSISLDFSI
jgi:hypothetical protein